MSITDYFHSKLNGYSNSALNCINVDSKSNRNGTTYQLRAERSGPKSSELNCERAFKIRWSGIGASVTVTTTGENGENFIFISLKRNHSECVLSLHSSSMGKSGTFLDDHGDLQPRLQVKGHRESASRSGQNAATHHRGLQSGVSFT